MRWVSSLIMVLFFASWQLAKSQSVNHWATAVFNNDTLRYFVGSSDPAATWRSSAFNDGSWAQGMGGVGYGDNDDNTVIPQCTSVFLRIKFNMPDTALIVRALLSMDYDDAFVAYLNDVEIARAGITGVHPTFDQTGIDHEAKMYRGGVPESFYIEKNFLKTCLLPGENILAIQVHNSSPASSDLSSNAFLSFGIVNSTTIFRNVPHWFPASSDFSSSNHPIVIINTDGGVAIPDNPRVLANMKIIYRGAGFRNYLADLNTPEYLNYNGRINIEIRGSSSQSTPKKQYGFSTKKADGITNNNVNLLGLPDENDWILNGLVFDPSLIRNYLSFNLSRNIGEYASRTVFCEVVLNGSYLGLYLLLEKIKPDAERVDIVEIDKNDITLPDITGGYITKADKTTGGDPVAWSMSSYLGTNDVPFIHEWPEPENVTSVQTTYIKTEFDKLSISASGGDISPISGYPSVIDIPSFIDYMIINEISANADAYQFSTFYHKDRNGKLRAGPIWDLDLTFGNDLFFWGFNRSKPDKWQFNNGDNEGPKYWRDLYNNSLFRCYLSKRWNQLIQTGQPLNYTSIETFIDQTASLISEAAVRENYKWGTSSNHDNDVTAIKTFLQQRIPWMTITLGSYSDCSNVETPPLVITKIMYEPDSTVSYPDSKDQEFIELVNTGDKSVNLTGVYFSGTGFVYQFPVNSSIEPGARKILASNTAVFMDKYRVVPSGKFTRNLSNTGENLVLTDAFGNVIDSVSYSNLPPWPDVSSNGFYLELPDPLSDNSKATNWIASNTKIVSVEDQEIDLAIKLYPSPVRDKLMLEFPGGRYKLQLYDFQGSLLKTVTVNSDLYSLDLTSYNTGIYLVRIITPTGSFVRKIIKE
ncbi:MAG TPA: secretion system protein Por [Bacteroidales bacterium]|nr:secretion system protein Por [Bacteroidales bacterium]